MPKISDQNSHPPCRGARACHCRNERRCPCHDYNTLALWDDGRMLRRKRLT